MAGTMDFDFRNRCAAVIPEDGDMPEHQIIIYGLTAREVGDALLPVFDLPTPYAELSRGGRRPGAERIASKHFFNKRIMTHGEGIGGAAPAVQDSGDEGGVGAPDGEGSEISIEEAKTEIERWERAGRGDIRTGEESNEDWMTT